MNLFVIKVTIKNTITLNASLGNQNKVMTNESGIYLLKLSCCKQEVK